MKERKPGVVREGRLPIYSHEGHVLGNVGPTATEATVSRFVGHHRVKLTKKDRRTAWVESPPLPKPKLKPKAVPLPRASDPEGAPPPTRQNHTLEISLKAAKGSVSKPVEKKAAPRTKAE
jgi:hypothetical protein